MIARVHWAPLVASVAIGAMAGCGSSTTVLGGSTVTTTRHAREAPAPVLPPLPGNGTAVPTPGPTGVAPRAGAVAVIRAWSDALRRGDVRGAARYFAIPSVMVNGTDAGGGAIVITIGTPADAAAANTTLPCGARLISADQRGRYVNALFRLTGRPGPGGSDCGGGAGQTARTNFVIIGGHIVEWIRAPDDPGDNGTSPAQPVPSVPDVPTVPQGQGPTV